MNPQKLIIIGAGLLFTLACNALAQTTSTPLPIATVTPGLPPPTVTAVPPTSTPVPAASESPVATDTPAPTTSDVIPHFNAGQNVTITSIRMFDPNHGWGIGGTGGPTGDHVLRTDDSGVHWRDVTPPQPGSGGDTAVQAVGYFLDSNTAWVSYAEPVTPLTPDKALLWRTQDGGETWASSQLDIGTTFEFFAPSQIQFLDAHTGWLLVHEGVGMNHDYVSIFNTTDGGGTWTRIVDPEQPNLSMSCSKTGITFVSAQMGWVTGDCNGVAAGVYFYRTTDGGATWTEVVPPPPADTPDLFTRQDDACGAAPLSTVTPPTDWVTITCQFLASPGTPQQHLLYRTGDGGQTWQLISALPFFGGNGSIQLFPDASGLALGAHESRGDPPYTVYSTQDAGKTWTKISDVNWLGQLEFVNPQTSWVVATDAAGDVALVQSFDGGRTWKQLTPTIGQ